MPQSKATKKFEKKHLKGVLKRRKEFAKVKQRIQTRERKKARRAELEENEQNAGKTATNREAANAQKLASMNVDEFFQSPIDIPELPQKAKKASASLKASTKRKRDDEENAHAETDDDASDIGAGLQNLLEDGSDAGSDSLGDPDEHKHELDALAAKDPEFYKYLQENDAELLDFGKNGELEGMDEHDEDEDERDVDQAAADGEDGNEVQEDGMTIGTGKNEVTEATVKKWQSAMSERHSIRAAKELSLAFRAAVHPNDDGKMRFKYSISNPDVYHEVLVVTLESFSGVLDHHISKSDKGAGRVRVATDSKKYRALSPLIKSHATSILYLIKSLSDAATLKLTLNSLQKTLPYLLSFKKLLRELGRSIVDIWSDFANSEATRIAAFLVLRSLMVMGDPGIREDSLRSAYQGLVKNSRKTTIHTMAGINLMKNSAAELWAIDTNVGYTTGFTFIRQLAIHLRSTIKNNSNESYKAVYNWQYVHSLDFWSRTVSLHCDNLRVAASGKESPFRSLIYPTVQITLGAIRLIPTAQYFPLRFQLIRSLLRISRTTDTYIPIAPLLYEVLMSAEMRKPPKPSTLKPLDFDTSIKASKSYLRSRVYQDGIGEEVVALFSDFFAIWTKNIAFPELALPVVFMLKRWLKQMSGKQGNKNGKVNSSLSLFVQKIEANSRWIEERRATVDFAPNDRAGVEGFLKDTAWEKAPLGAFVSAQRQIREEKMKVLAEGRRQDRQRDEKTNKRPNGRSGPMDGGDSDSAGEE